MNQPSQGMQSCNLRVIVFWFFFFSWSRDHLFGLQPEMLCRLLRLTGPERCSVSIWQSNILHSWTTPLTFPWLMIAQVKRKPSEGKMMRPQRMDTQTQSIGWSTWGKHTSPEGRVSLKCISIWNSFIFTAIFPMCPMSRGREEPQHSQTIPPTWQRSKVLPWS